MNRADRRAAARPGRLPGGLEITETHVKVISGSVTLWLHRPARPAGDSRTAYTPEDAARIGAELIACARSLGWEGDVPPAPAQAPLATDHHPTTTDHQEATSADLDR